MRIKTIFVGLSVVFAFCCCQKEESFKEDTKDYFTITSVGNTYISFTKEGEPDPITLEYRIGSKSWSAYTIGNAVSLTDGENLQFRAGEGGNSCFSKGFVDSLSVNYVLKASGDGTIRASGNIMSLLDRTLERNDVPAYGFLALFDSCEKLTDASKLKLPATTLAEACYYAMFIDCTSLTKVPQLPATTLAEGCYYCMFFGCTSLTAAPQLPATTLAENCYYAMFNGCTKLTAAPELHVTTLANQCYAGMFMECTSLTEAPQLPATTLADACYFAMFYDCTSLTKAPQLPATTLAEACYYAMFYGCTSLTTAPPLPATTLAEDCYRIMFKECTKLNYVKALFTTTPSDTYTKEWLLGVSSTGTFVKSKYATWDKRGNNGIPEGWAVQIAEHE